MRSAWLKLRRNRYFIGPYSDTPDVTVIGPPPYFVLSEGCPPDELGRTIRIALDASVHEIVSGIAPFGLPKIGRSTSLGSQASKIVAPSSVGRES
jgi:hypothetical protein